MPLSPICMVLWSAPFLFVGAVFHCLDRGYSITKIIVAAIASSSIYILTGIMLCCGWKAMSAAAYLSISGVGRTWLAVVLSAATSIGKFVQEGRVSESTFPRGWSWEKFLRYLKSLIWGCTVGTVFWMGIFLWELHSACKVFVTNRPHIDIYWHYQTPFEFFHVQGGPSVGDVTSEYLKDRREYVIQFNYSRDNLVPASFRVLMQFPYPMEISLVTPTKAQTPDLSLMASPLPMYINPSANKNVLIGTNNSKIHRYFVLSEPYIEPGGTVRMILVLNVTKAITMGTCVGGSGRPSPPVGISEELLEDREYIYGEMAFSYGGESEAAAVYAPFRAIGDKLITLEPFRTPPPLDKLQICSDAY